MTTISERLRTHVGSRGGPAIENGAWSMMTEAADTIDALVAALQNFVDRDEYCREDYEEAEAALALARKGGMR